MPSGWDLSLGPQPTQPSAMNLPLPSTRRCEGSYNLTRRPHQATGYKNKAAVVAWADFGRRGN
jgi:hypothetical protein